MFVNNAELRVRYQETDKMGVVYHSNYFVWFEIGRTEYLRALGYPYERLEKEGIMLPVVECNAKFKKGAIYDDEIVIKASVQELKGASVILYYEVFRKSTDELSNRYDKTCHNQLASKAYKAQNSSTCIVDCP